MISELGFFSPEAREDELKIGNDYRDLFQLSEQIAKEFLRLLRDANLDRESERNLALNALAARSLEFFQSMINQLRQGSAPPAKVVCRSLIETVYKLRAIQLSSNGIDLFIAQERKSRLQKLKGVQAYRKAHPELGPSKELDAEVEQLTKERPKKTESNEWARLAEMDDFHNLYFQWVSDDTHAGIESLNHYFDEVSPYLMTFGPTDKEISTVAAIGHRSILLALETYARFQCVSIDLARYRNQTDALENEYAERSAAT
jgi:hypothetical protein